MQGFVATSRSIRRTVSDTVPEYQVVHSLSTHSDDREVFLKKPLERHLANRASREELGLEDSEKSGCISHRSGKGGRNRHEWPAQASQYHKLQGSYQELSTPFRTLADIGSTLDLNMSQQKPVAATVRQKAELESSLNPRVASRGLQDNATEKSKLTSFVLTTKRDVTEDERIAERNRKGRERSLRTRRRNATKLRLLEQNCWYFSKENEMLREVLICLGEEGHSEKLFELLNSYICCQEEKPEPHMLSQAEPFYKQVQPGRFPLCLPCTSTEDGRTPSGPPLDLDYDLTESLVGTEQADTVGCNLLFMNSETPLESAQQQRSQRELAHLDSENAKDFQVLELTETNLTDRGPTVSSFIEYNVGNNAAELSLDELKNLPPLDIDEIASLLEKGKQNASQDGSEMARVLSDGTF